MGTRLGRPVMELDLPRVKFTLAELLAALAEAEPRIARYLRGDDGQPPFSLRPLLSDHLLEPDTPIPDGVTVTLLYAMAGGTSKASMGSGPHGPPARSRRAPITRKGCDL